VARPVLVYTLLRLVLFLGGFGAALLAGLDGLVAVLVGFAVSALLSAVLLRPQRDAIAEAAAARSAAAANERARLQARLREDGQAPT
jgi:membrane protein implicated in regulation of membrane protease activity